MSLPVKTRLAAIVELVAEGVALRRALEQHGFSAGQFQRALAGNRELAAAYARATEIRADLMADEIIRIADCEQTDPQRARNQIQARQWLASKLHARRYGERIDVNVTQSVDISATLAEARSRAALPVSDHSKTLDADYVELAPQIDVEPGD